MDGQAIPPRPDQLRLVLVLDLRRGAVVIMDQALLQSDATLLDFGLSRLHAVRPASAGSLTSCPRTGCTLLEEVSDAMLDRSINGLLFAGTNR